MSISVDLARVTSVAIASQTTFPFTGIFVFTDNDLDVYQNGVKLLNTSFTVTLTGPAPSDGSVVLNVGADAGDIIIIERSIARTQPTVYNPGTAFPAKSHENALDRVTLLTQDNNTQARRSPEFDASTDANLDWRYLDLPDASTPKIPVFDPSTKTISYSDVGAPTSTVDFSALTGTLDISGADPRILEITKGITGAVPRNLQGVLEETVSIRDFGAVGDGVTNDAPAFALAAAASKQIEITSGAYRISNVLSLGLTSLVFGANASLNIDNGITVTVGSVIADPNFQIFTGLGFDGVTITNTRPIYAEWWGADVDGAVDSKQAIQNAISASPSHGWLQLNVGRYRLDSTLTISQEGYRISGVTPSTQTGGSSLDVNFATGDAITAISDDAIILEDLFIRHLVTKTSGSTIKVEGNPSGNVINEFSRFRNIRHEGGFQIFNFESASGWTMRDCQYVNHSFLGVNIQNVTNSAQGSNSITDCFFDTATGTARHIFHSTSSGLTVTGCTFRNGQSHYGFVPDPGTLTSNVLFTNCSFESATGDALIFDNAAVTGDFVRLAVTGCAFAGNAGSAMTFTSTGGTQWIENFSITGCSFSVGNGADGLVFTHVARVTVVGCFFLAFAGAGDAIRVGSLTREVLAADNLYIGTFTNKFTSAAPIESVKHAPDILYGSAVFNPGPIPVGGSISTTVSVFGARVGMVAMAAHSTRIGIEVGIEAYVSASDVVTVIFFNHASVGTPDFANGNLTVQVWDSIGTI